MHTYTYFFAALMALMASCTSKNGETGHTVECSTALYSGEYENGYDFSVDTTFTSDGHFGISVYHNVYANTEFYRLYSPEGQLLLLASGASEACCLNGYALTYDGDKVTAIHETEDLEEEFYSKLNLEDSNNAEILKNWYERIVQKEPVFTSEFDEHGKLCGITQIDTPPIIDLDEIELSIGEDLNFWGSDIEGGKLCFFAMYKERPNQGSSHHYLYVDGELGAEMEFWDGKFMKLRTFNLYGKELGNYDDSGIDAKKQMMLDLWNDY